MKRLANIYHERWNAVGISVAYILAFELSWKVIYVLRCEIYLENQTWVSNLSYYSAVQKEQKVQLPDIVF